MHGKPVAFGNNGVPTIYRNAIGVYAVDSVALLEALTTKQRREVLARIVARFEGEIRTLYRPSDIIPA